MRKSKYYLVKNKSRSSRCKSNFSICRTKCKRLLSNQTIWDKKNSNLPYFKILVESKTSISNSIKKLHVSIRKQRSYSIKMNNQKRKINRQQVNCTKSQPVLLLKSLKHKQKSLSSSKKKSQMAFQQVRKYIWVKKLSSCPLTATFMWVFITKTSRRQFVI